MIVSAWNYGKQTNQKNTSDGMVTGKASIDMFNSYEHEHFNDWNTVIINKILEIWFHLETFPVVLRKTNLNCEHFIIQTGNLVCRHQP